MKARSPARKSLRLISLLLMLSLLLGAVPLTISAEAKAPDLVSDTVSAESPLSAESQTEQRATQLGDDGIYRLDNAGVHLSAVVNASSLLTNTAPYLYTSGSALNQLWRITRHSNGLYTIRPYQNYNQLLAYDSSTGKICLTTATTITSNMLWSIDTASYHTIRCAANNMALANDAYATSNSPLHLETYNSSSSASWQRWLLVEASSPASGIAWKASNSSYSYTSTSTSLAIVTGRNVTYSTVYYSPTDISQEFTWTSSNPSVATVAIGRIATVSPGTTTVTATHRSSGLTLTINVTVLPFSNGTYFVMNAETEKYMQPDDNGDTHMEQHAFSGEGIQKWRIEHYSAYPGYYTIRNESSGLYLTAPNNTTDGASVVQQAYNSSAINRQLWKITKLTNGQYQIQAKAREGSGLYLAVGSGENLDGVNIEQRLHSSISGNKGNWMVLNHDKSILLAINDSDGWNRHLYFGPTESNLQTAKNGTVSITSTIQYSSASVPTMLNYLQSNKIFIVHTHGAQDAFKIANSDSDKQYINMDDIKTKDLSNLSFALLLTCNTGANYNPYHITSNSPVNIVEQMVICGAETVVGFSDTTYVIDCNDFAIDITEKLIKGGLSVEDAIDSINYTFYVKNMSQIAVIAGNKNNKLR